MNKKITVGILRKFLWFCGIGPIPAPLLGIARHTPFVAICGVRALENAQSRAVTGFERATTSPHTFCGGSVAFAKSSAKSSARLRRRHPIPAARHEKKVKKFLRAARNACYHVALFGGEFSLGTPRAV